MYKYLILVSLTIIPFLTSCATMIRGTTEDLQINSEPDKAKATISTGMSCTTPCAINLKRNQSYTIKFEKENCQDTMTSVYPSLSGSGVLLGGIIDYGTGAVYDLKPNPVVVSMACGEDRFTQQQKPESYIDAQLKIGDTIDQVHEQGIVIPHDTCKKEKNIDNENYQLWDFATNSCQTEKIKGHALLFREVNLVEIRQVKDINDLDF